jgi:glycosyltransferase involved in cell wall biosynthesis
VKVIDVRGDRFDAWERVRLPLAALTDRLGLLHCPSQTAPPLTPCPIVLTVHDLIPLKVPGETTTAERQRFARALGASVRRARRIITVSEFTRRDLITTFRVPEDRVDVVRWGVDAPSPGPAAPAEATAAARYSIGVPYFVAFGGEAPRKNVPRLLEALSRFTREVTAEVRLVLIGVPDGVQPRFRAQAEALGVGKSVVVLGYLEDGEVNGLLAQAEALVYPSLYEGFGLPILEAMAVGTPVITSKVTSMPEIAGDAALLIDPTDSASIAEAMRACYLDDGAKAALRARGFRRIAAFTWERAAEETRSVYERALGGLERSS